MSEKVKITKHPIFNHFSDIDIYRTHESFRITSRGGYLPDDSHFSQLWDILTVSGNLTMWDRDLPRSPVRCNRYISAMYFWVEYQNNEHTVIYVGESGSVFKRLYSHYWAPGGIIYQHASNQLSCIHGRCVECGKDKPTVYKNWLMTGEYLCGCVPRYWIHLANCDKPTRLMRERLNIETFNPILNNRYTD